MFIHSRKADPQQLTNIANLQTGLDSGPSILGKECPLPMLFESEKYFGKLPKHKMVIPNIVKAKHSHSRLKFWVSKTGLWTYLGIPQQICGHLSHQLHLAAISSTHAIHVSLRKLLHNSTSYTTTHHGSQNTFQSF